MRQYNKDKFKKEVKEVSGLYNSFLDKKSNEVEEAVNELDKHKGDLLVWYIEKKETYEDSEYKKSLATTAINRLNTLFKASIGSELRGFFEIDNPVKSMEVRKTIDSEIENMINFLYLPLIEKKWRNIISEYNMKNSEKLQIVIGKLERYEGNLKKLNLNLEFLDYIKELEKEAKREKITQIIESFKGINNPHINVLYEDKDCSLYLKGKEVFYNLIELEEYLVSVDTKIIGGTLLETINKKIDNLVKQTDKIYAPCFNNIATSVLTPVGGYGKYKNEKGQDIIYFYRDSDPIALDNDGVGGAETRITNAIKGLTEEIEKNKILKNNGTINRGFEDNEFKDDKQNLWSQGGLESEIDEGGRYKLDISISQILNWYTLPYLQYCLIHKRVPKIKTKICGDGSVEETSITFRKTPVNEKTFKLQIREFYKELHIYLVKNLLKLVHDPSLEGRLQNEVSEIFKYLGECGVSCEEFIQFLKNNCSEKGLTKEDSKSKEVFDKILDLLGERFKTVNYTFTNIFYGVNMKNLQFVSYVGGIIDVKSKKSIRENLKDTFISGFIGEGATNEYQCITDIAERFDESNIIFTGIYSLNMNMEKKSILFAYKKYDDLYENNIPLSENIIIGRDENTYEDVYLNLGEPQAIVNAIIAGSGSGKGVLTLAMLVNLLVHKNSVIYADFKPDMAATLWKISKDLRTPIFAIDGKGTGVDGIQISDVEKAIEDENGNPISAKLWQGFDRFLDTNTPERKELGIAKSVFLDKTTKAPTTAITSLPYFKTMQLFVAFGRARLAAKNKLVSIGDNGEKIFIILDEAQMANNFYSNIISDLQSKQKKFKKEKPEYLPIIEKYYNCYVDDLCSSMIDVVITTGRMARMGIIIIGQQTDPGQWKTPQGSWKNCTFGYMMGNTYNKLIGKNGGTSPKYGLPKNLLESETVGKALGYWALCNQPDSGSQENAKPTKTYLILNENDYNPETQTGGTYTAGLLKGKAGQIEELEELKKDLTDGNNPRIARANVGFDGMMQQFMETDEKYAENIGYSYQVYEAFLQEAGLVKSSNNENAPFNSLYEYIYSMNPKYFLTTAQLVQAFIIGGLGKTETENKNSDVKNIDFYDYLRWMYGVIEDEDPIMDKNGKSYLPIKEEWEDFISPERFNEKLLELKNQKFEENQERIANITGLLSEIKEIKEDKDKNIKDYDEIVLELNRLGIDENEETLKLKKPYFLKELTQNLEQEKKTLESLKVENIEIKYQNYNLEWIGRVLQRYIKSNDEPDRIKQEGYEETIKEPKMINLYKFQDIVKDYINEENEKNKEEKNNNSFISSVGYAELQEYISEIFKAMYEGKPIKIENNTNALLEFENKLAKKINPKIKGNSVITEESLKGYILEEYKKEKNSEKSQIFQVYKEITEEIENNLSTDEAINQISTIVENLESKYLNLLIKVGEYSIKQRIFFENSLEKIRGVLIKGLSIESAFKNLGQSKSNGSTNSTSEEESTNQVSSNGEASQTSSDNGETQTTPEKLEEQLEEERKKQVDKCINELIPEYHASFTKIKKAIVTVTGNTKRENFEKGRQLLLIDLDNWRNYTDIKKFLESIRTKYQKENIENDVIEIVYDTFVEKFYPTAIEEYKQKVNALEFEKQETADELNKGNKSTFEPNTMGEAGKSTPTPTKFNGKSFTTSIDLNGVKFNKEDPNSAQNFGAVWDITNRIVKEIYGIYGMNSNIHKLVLTGENLLLINDSQVIIDFKSKPEFYNDLPPAVKVQVDNGDFTGVTNVGLLFKELLDDCKIVELGIENNFYAHDNYFMNEIGVRKENYYSLFRRYKSLRLIYTPDSEFSRDDVYSAEKKSGIGLGAKLANFFGFGGSSRPNPSSTEADEDTKDGFGYQVLHSRPVKILTHAFGWTVGVQAAYVTAMLLGPWGLLFGGLAAAGAYKEVKKDMRESNADYLPKSGKPKGSSKQSKDKKEKKDKDE